MSGIEKYNLTEKEFQKSLEMAEIATLMKGKSVKNPKAIFIVSQAGGGKTGLKMFVGNENQIGVTENVFIELNPDEIAIYHKYYKQILEEYPNESYRQLQKFVSPAIDNYIRQRAVALRNNIIQEGTFGNTEGYMKTLEFLKNGGMVDIGKMGEDGKRETTFVPGGYTVEIDVLAVDKFESLLAAYEREQYFIEAGLPPRAVTEENHDKAYNNMLTTIKQIENRKLYDSIRIFKRGYVETRPEIVHIAGDGRYASTVECIIDTRAKNRIQLLNNPEDYLKRINTLKNEVKSETQIIKIEKLRRDFMQELEKNRDNNFRV